AKWCEQHGALDNLLSRVDGIKGTRGENLRKLKDWLPKARELLTVKRDVALPFPFEKLAEFKPDAQVQRAQYERYGFKTWLKDLENAPALQEQPASPPPTVQKRKYRAVLTEDELKDVLLRLEATPLAGFNAIGAGDDPMTARLVGIALAFGDEGVYVPFAHDYAGAPEHLSVETALALLKPWLQRAERRKVGADMKL